MSSSDIRLPDLGNDVSEVQIDEWLAKVGDTVTAGDQLVLVTTPKVSLEVEAPASGVLSAIHVAADEIAAADAILGTISSD